jgi:hypothetical protein
VADEVRPDPDKDTRPRKSNKSSTMANENGVEGANGDNNDRFEEK